MGGGGCLCVGGRGNENRKIMKAMEKVNRKKKEGMRKKGEKNNHPHYHFLKIAKKGKCRLKQLEEANREKGEETRNKKDRRKNKRHNHHFLEIRTKKK